MNKEKIPPLIIACGKGAPKDWAQIMVRIARRVLEGALPEDDLLLALKKGIFF